MHLHAQPGRPAPEQLVSCPFLGTEGQAGPSSERIAPDLAQLAQEARDAARIGLRHPKIIRKISISVTQSPDPQA